MEGGRSGGERPLIGPLLSILEDGELLVLRSPIANRPLGFPEELMSPTPAEHLPPIDPRQARDPRAIVLLPNGAIGRHGQGRMSLN